MPEYAVHLRMRVQADEADQAVSTFITFLVENGLTDWVYRVENPDTSEILGFFNGYGLPVDIDTLGPAPVLEDADDTPEEQTGVQTEESDDKLITLAQSLNDADAPAEATEATEATEQPTEQPQE